MSFKKPFFALFCIMCLLLSCSPSDESEPDREAGTERSGDVLLPNGDSWQSIKERGSGQLIIHYLPADGFAYSSSEGELTGLTVETLRYFVAWLESNYPVEITAKFIPEEGFSTFYRNVRRAEEGVIGMANVTITEERQEELDFSPPYMQNIAVLVTHETVEELDALEQIENRFESMSALAFEGTLHQTRLEVVRDHYYPGLEIEMAHSNQEILDRIGEDSGVFAYLDIYNYWRAAELGSPIKRHPVGDDAAEEFGYILPLNSDWTPKVEAFLESEEAFIHSRTYREIMERHLGSELTGLLLDVN